MSIETGYQETKGTVSDHGLSSSLCPTPRPWEDSPRQGVDHAS